ncbi:MAG: ribbon-helix-helix protein, CopG family [Cyanobium sp.]
MGALSLRLPDDLERKLSQEASLSGQPRSQLIRAALETLHLHRERERAEAALVGAATALATNDEAREETLAIAAEFLHAENEALALAEPGVGLNDGNNPASLWWR